MTRRRKPPAAEDDDTWRPLTLTDLCDQFVTRDLDARYPWGWWLAWGETGLEIRYRMNGNGRGEDDTTG